ncbi:MAG TPA: YggT family protein [Patescibacteria group bacterium]|nr:YggT family protein [Patescibacteria group bacterium]
MESTRFILVRVINIIGSIVGFFIAVRILLRLLSANASTPIVSWIYSVSGNLVYPFNGIFRDVSVRGAGTLDLSALVALFAYAILFTVIISLINSVALPLVHEDDAGHVHSHI